MEIMNMPKKKKTNKNHLVVHNEYPKPFQCQMCDSKFRFPSLLNRHIAQMHDGENGDTTNLQPTQYNKINEIEGFEGFDLHSTQIPINDQTIKKEDNSMLMDPNTGKPIFSCNMCDFTTHTRKCLMSHLKSNDFCCNDCGEKFHGKSGRQDIKIHWKMYHSETTQIYKKPKKGEVYNIGGGRFSNCSIIEALDLVEKISQINIKRNFIKKPRVGDHIWYISNLKKFKKHYPKWKQKYNTQKILEELIEYQL